MRTFQECGGASYMILVLALLGISVSVLGLALSFRQAKGAALVCGVALTVAAMCFGGGLLASAVDRARVDEAIASPDIDASLRERIRAQGYLESRSCTWLGTLAGALPLVLGSVGLAVALASRRRETAPAR
jgi:hypothetical protein